MLSSVYHKYYAVLILSIMKALKRVLCCLDNDYVAFIVSVIYHECYLSYVLSVLCDLYHKCCDLTARDVYAKRSITMAVGGE